MGTFLASGTGLPRLISSEEGPWHELCPHQSAFSQAVLSMVWELEGLKDLSQ